MIADGTRRLVGGLFECADLGPVEVKGFAEPVQAWRASSARALSRAGSRRSTPAALTPLVGREEEIELLLRRWEQAKGGEGQVVLLSGEPGIGKSRLPRRCRSDSTSEPHPRCATSARRIARTARSIRSSSQLERAAGFARDDTPEARLDKLRRCWRGRRAPAEDVALLAELLSSRPATATPPLALTPQRKREQTLRGAAAAARGLRAREQPVLMVFEDAHWIDPTSRELLDLIVERVARLPVLLLITFRPEFQPPWPAGRTSRR